MSADIKTEQLLFIRKFLVVAPWCDCPRPTSERRRRDFVEQRNLSRGAIAMCHRRSTQRFVDTGEKVGAVPLQEIECPRFDQTLEHFLIRDPRAEPSAEI